MPEDNSIKDWVLREMVSKRDEDQSVVAKILMQNKEKARELATIREDGRVTIQKVGDSAENQILSYLLGAAYAKIAELREDDGVPVSELTDELKLNENTVGVSIKRLRDKGLILRKAEGVYRVEYRKIAEVIGRLASTVGVRSSRQVRPKKADVFDLYSESGEPGLRRYLNSLGIVALKNIIKEKRLDPAGTSLKWTEKSRLIELIIGRVESRLRHGDVFLREKPVDESKKVIPERTHLDQDSVQ